MKIFDGETYRDATAEELEEFKQARIEEEEHMANQEPSADELILILTGESV